MTTLRRIQHQAVLAFGLVLCQCNYDVVFNRVRETYAAGASAGSLGLGVSGEVNLASTSSGGASPANASSVTVLTGGTNSIAILSAGAAGSPSTSCGVSSLRAGNTQGTVLVGTTTRSYTVHTPANYTGAKPVPLVLDFHGLQDTPSIEAANSGFRELSDSEGFIVVWPLGIDYSWNLGPCCTESRTVDDVGFARALVTQLQSQACIDPKRIYAVGYVMGGGMALYLGCSAADVFAGVMSSGFDLLLESEAPCQPSRSITEISFRGTADRVIAYEGEVCTPPTRTPITVHDIGAVPTFEKWASLDQCTGTPTSADANGCSSYQQCQGGVEVTLCTTIGGGEEWGDAGLAWSRLKTHQLP